jgi:hypothetical protein
LEVIFLTGLLLLVGYAWMRKDERSLEQGKALTEMSARALQASGYQLVHWGEEGRKRKTASLYPGEDPNKSESRQSLRRFENLTR